MSGVIFSDYIQRKKELKEFYSWIESLLYSLLKQKQSDKVRKSLTTQTLHYTFNRFWSRIPIKDGDLEVRGFISRFLNGGAEIEQIKEDDEFLKLYEWLKKA